MPSLDVKVARLQGNSQAGYWEQRMVAKVAYAFRLSKVMQGQHDNLLQRVCDWVV